MSNRECINSVRYESCEKICKKLGVRDQCLTGHSYRKDGGRFHAKSAQLEISINFGPKLSAMKDLGVSTPGFFENTRKSHFSISCQFIFSTRKWFNFGIMQCIKTK